MIPDPSGPLIESLVSRLKRRHAAGSRAPILILMILLLFGVPRTISTETTPEPFFLRSLSTIIIDPGHGGRDPGAVVEIADSEGNTSTIYEKELNLSIARSVARLLREQFGEAAVILTRDDDRFLSLTERSYIANMTAPPEGTSKIFISIHANAASSEQVSGYEIWKRPDSQRIDFLKTGIVQAFQQHESGITNDHLHRELLRAELLLAESIDMAFFADLGGMTRSRGVKQGVFSVLRNTLLPAVLLEVGFMTNQEELAMLLDPEYQQDIAESLVRAVLVYAGMTGSF